MSLRTTRLMTSVFLVRDDQVLLLYRVGSRAVADSWVGVGGHLEPEEIGDPTRGVLRELDEGELRWFDLTLDPSTLPMPPTGSVALEHWLAVGRHDDDVRTIVMTGDGPRVLSMS